MADTKPLEDRLDYVIDVHMSEIYTSAYPPAMSPPRWPDEQGRLIPTYPRPQCGREVASRFRGFRVEHLRHVGWQLFMPATYVNWCGHGQEIIPMPLVDGWDAN